MKEYKTNRRNFIKTSVSVAAVGALGVLSGRVGKAAEAEKLPIKVAGYDYDRVRAITDGQVGMKVLMSVFTTRISTRSMITRLALSQNMR